jgi:hypothetical protein
VGRPSGRHDAEVAHGALPTVDLLRYASSRGSHSYSRSSAGCSQSASSAGSGRYSPLRGNDEDVGRAREDVARVRTMVTRSDERARRAISPTLRDGGVDQAEDVEDGQARVVADHSDTARGDEGRRRPEAQQGSRPPAVPPLHHVVVLQRPLDVLHVLRRAQALDHRPTHRHDVVGDRRGGDGGPADAEQPRASGRDRHDPGEPQGSHPDVEDEAVPLDQIARVPIGDVRVVEGGPTRRTSQQNDVTARSRSPAGTACARFFTRRTPLRRGRG